MKKVLIIAGDFLPYSPSLGGVIRILTLSEFLRKNGAEVYILTSRSLESGYFGYEEKTKNLKITYLDNKLQSYILKSAGDRKMLLAKSTLPGKQKPRAGFKNILTWFKYKIKNLVYEFAVPDINIFMKNKFYKEAKKIISINNIENLLISSPPHSMHVIGTKLKKHFGKNLNYIMDYRDSWNTIPLFSKRNFMSKFIAERYEKKALSACDHFTFISAPMLSKVEKYYNIRISGKSVLIMNGFIEEIKSLPAERKDGIIRIGYFGSISDSPNSMRNISSLLDILSAGTADFDFLEFHFYGEITISAHDISPLKSVVVHESLKHKAALDEMMKMDFLLLVHSDNRSSDEVITGKFFEYVSARKPVICLGPENMEASRLISKFNVGFSININDTDDMMTKLLELKSINISLYYHDLDISIFKRDVQYEKFLNIII
jgi:glycosyltransferase involved in cell wall biosynthesis